MSLVVQQNATASLSQSGSTTVEAVFGSTPTHTNLLLAIGFGYTGNGTPVANTAAGWTLLTYTTNGTTEIVSFVVYKYAGASESTTQEPITTGENLWGLSIWEVSGVTGTIGTDVVATHLNPDAGHGTLTGTISSFNTAQANELLIGLFSTDNFTASSTITTTSVSPSVTNENLANGTHTGTFSAYCVAQSASFGVIASSGTAVSGTFTTGGTAGDMHYTIVELAEPGGSTETGNVSMALGGVGFAAQGSDAYASTALVLRGVSYTGAGALEETAAVNLALGKLAFSARASREETGTGTLALQGVAIAAAAYDLNSLNPVRQFSTFG